MRRTHLGSLFVALASLVMVLGLLGPATGALAEGLAKTGVAPAETSVAAATEAASTDSAGSSADSATAASTTPAPADDQADEQAAGSQSFAGSADGSEDKPSQEAPTESGAQPDDTPAPVEGLEYVYVDTQVVAVGEDEYIAIGLSDQDAVVSSATLELFPADGGDPVELDASALSENAMLFTANFSDDAQATTWIASTLTYTLQGSDEQHEIDLPSEGDPYQFDVVRADTAAAIGDTSGDTTVLTIDEDGKLESADSVESALATASEGSASTGEGTRSYSLSTASIGQDFLVAIDPGHGGYDSGAVGYGLQEKNITLSIANYMRAELNSYAGVSTMMTRTDDSYVGLQARVDKASAAGARVFVSIHINASDGGSSRGAEVWVPNGSSYNYSAHTMGTALGNKIVAQLANLGLSNRGVKVRDYPSGSSSSVYPDGSRADYYAVIRGARKAGIPGIIVEHAFIDNAGDASFMKNENNLKAMGVADATGVAQQYGFTKSSESVPAGSTPVYRVYNPNSGLHHYTTDSWERNHLLDQGWRSEGVAFYVSASKTDTPVYREYNPNDGNHNFTTDWYEHDFLIKMGWRSEGIAWYQSDNATNNIYRLYNPNSGEHVYTTSKWEYDSVIKAGWRGEGIAWKSL